MAKEWGERKGKKYGLRSGKRGKVWDGGSGNMEMEKGGVVC